MVHQPAAGGAPVDGSLQSTNAADTFNITFQVSVVEPLFLSPFANNENDKAGFLGINNMVLTINLDTACKRLFSSSTGYIPNNAIQLTQVSNSSALLLNFLSLQPEQYAKINAKNVLPYLDMPRYLYNTQQTLAAYNPAVSINQQITQLTFNNIQLNQIPDLIMIVARLPMATQNCNNSSFFLPIRGISINFNNQSGILSSATANQLFFYLRKMGLIKLGQNSMVKQVIQILPLLMQIRKIT